MGRHFHSWKVLGLYCGYACINIHLSQNSLNITAKVGHGKFYCINTLIKLMQVKVNLSILYLWVELIDLGF